MSQIRDKRGFFITLIFALVVSWLVLYPLFMLIQTSFTSVRVDGYTIDNYIRAYSGSGPYEVLWNSLIYAAGSSILAACMGTLLALMIERTNVPAKRLLGILIIIPWLTPPILSSLAWILLLGPRAGIMNIFLKNLFLLEETPFNIFSLPGMIFITGLGTCPLIFVIVSSALRSMDPSFEEAALCATRSPFYTFFRVTLPLVLPSMLSAWMFLFIISIESFATPLLLGIPARIMVFTTKIYEAVQILQPPDFPLACTHSITPLIICVTLAIIYQKKVLTGAAERFATISGKGLRTRAVDIGNWKYVAFGFVCLYLFFSFILPILILFARSFFIYDWPDSIWDIPKLVTLSNYQDVFAQPVFLRSFRNSLFLALLGATMVMLLSSSIAYLAVKTQLPGRGVVATLGMLPIGVPAIVFAMGLLTAYAILPVMIYATIWILLIGYVSRTTPLGLTSISGSMLQIHKELDESATICGASRPRVFIRIILPLLKHGFLSGWILCFTILIKEMDQSILLYTFGNEVLSVAIFSFFEQGRVPAACAMAVLMLFLILSVYVITSKLIGAKPVATYSG